MGNLWTHVISFRRHPISYQDDLRRSLCTKATTSNRSRAITSTILNQPVLHRVDCDLLPKTGSYGQLYKIISKETRNNQSFILSWAIFKKSSQRNFARIKLTANDVSSTSYIDKLCAAYAIPKANSSLKQLINSISQTISASKNTVLIQVKVSGKAITPIVPTKRVIVPTKHSARAKLPHDGAALSMSSINKAPQAAGTVKTTVVSKNGNIAKQARSKNDKIWTTRKLRQAVRADRKLSHQKYHDGSSTTEQQNQPGMLGSFRIKK